MVYDRMCIRERQGSRLNSQITLLALVGEMELVI